MEHTQAHLLEAVKNRKDRKKLPGQMKNTTKNPRRIAKSYGHFFLKVILENLRFHFEILAR